jgi:type IV fimbrial biogenesis protein FimT
MNRCQKGFTLTEMIVVTGIVAILLGIAIPSYKYLTTSYRMSAEINNLVGDLQFARGEALKEGNGVTVCISSDGATCTGGTNWGLGWIVFSDPNSNATVDAGVNGVADRVLKVQAAFTGTTPDTFTAPVAAVTFNREGFASTTAGFAPTSVNLTESTGNNTYTRCLQISPVGMLTSQSHVGSPASCP